MQTTALYFTKSKLCVHKELESFKPYHFLVATETTLCLYGIFDTINVSKNNKKKRGRISDLAMYT